MNEPKTDAEFEAALTTLNHELIEDGNGFAVRNKDGGGITKLESEDESSALFEAWHLIKD
jgi:hypothetical protein